MFKHYLAKINKGGFNMAGTIDVHDLPKENVELVEKLVEFLREKVNKEKSEEKKAEDVQFATWPLGVMGSLTRREIYDNL